MSKIKILNAKRGVAVFMAVLMMILSLSYTNNKQTDAVNTDRTYYVFDAKTCVQKTNRTYTLEAFYSESNARNIVGETDNRKPGWVNSGVVKIMNSTNYIGTGFVVGDHTIATAAHCAYNESISKILLFETDKNNNLTNTLNLTPVECHIPYNYINGNLTHYDYALITVKEDLSDYAFNLGVPLDSCIEKAVRITSAGFPSKIGTEGNEITVNTATQHMMYSSNGHIVQGYPSWGTDRYRIAFTADTSKGNSGGPVYITEIIPGESKPCYTVIGICTHSGIDSNIATRITTDLIHFYNKNSNIKW